MPSRRRTSHRTQPSLHRLGPQRTGSPARAHRGDGHLHRHRVQGRVPAPTRGIAPAPARRARPPPARTGPQPVPTRAQTPSTPAQTLSIPAKGLSTGAQILGALAQPLSTRAQTLRIDAQTLSAPAQMLRTPAKTLRTPARTVRTSAQTLRPPARTLRRRAPTLRVRAHAHRRTLQHPLPAPPPCFTPRTHASAIAQRRRPPPTFRGRIPLCVRHGRQVLHRLIGAIKKHAMPMRRAAPFSMAHTLVH